MNIQILLKAVFASLTVLAFNAGAAGAPSEPKAAKAESKPKAAVKASKPKAAVKASEPKASTPASAAPDAAAATAKEAAPVAAATPPAAAPVVVAAAPVTAGANNFNRLLRVPAKYNAAPTEDGLHDPAAQGTLMLQSPEEAFASLPKSKKGNRVDWVKAITDNNISPRADIVKPNAKMKIKDLDVDMPVKGSMPDVVFSHKAHTQWLACDNCHPDVFEEEAGTNPMSMAMFSRGERCGVCHNTVAFPLSDCRKCHNKNKPAKASASAAEGAKP